MTREEVIRLAREAGYGWSMTDMHAPALERFAALVAKAEREVCAKLLDDYWYETQSVAATVIRKRGEPGP